MISKYVLPGVLSLMLATQVEAGLLENLSSYMWKAEKPKPPTIKVLIAKNKPGILLEVKGQYKLFDPNTMEYISTRYVGKRRYLQPLSNGIKWGEEFPGIFQLLIVPDDPGTTTLIDGVEYSGSLYIYDVGGRISVVSKIPIEEYLDGVMAIHTTGIMPEETLGAMAILGRTQAYFASAHPKTNFWDVDGTKTGYEGRAVSDKQTKLGRALTTTKYMVLTEEERPFNADWSQAKISLPEAERLGSQGMDAAEILKRAFPQAALKVMLSNTN
jgi:stage II sporulation protein D